MGGGGKGIKQEKSIAAMKKKSELKKNIRGEER